MQRLKSSVKRELEWLVPVVPCNCRRCSHQSGISRSYATLKASWRRRRNKRSDAVAGVIGRPSHQHIQKIYLPQKTKQTQMLGNGDAKASADERANYTPRRGLSNVEVFNRLKIDF
jgi:hypothetical protein